jgi:hypothetical protein
MKAETAATDSPVESPEPASPRTETDAETIDEAQANGTPENGESSAGTETATLQASSSSIKTLAKQPPKATEEPATKSQGSLTGKINNLVTTDLG